MTDTETITDDKARALFDEIEAKIKQEETSTPDLEEAPEAEASEETPEEPETEQVDTTKERDYLKLKVQATDSTLEKLTDEEIQQWEAKVRTNASEMEQRLKANASLEKRLATLETAATEGEPAEPAPKVDLTQVHAKLQEELGDEGSKGVRQAIEAAVKPLMDQAAKQAEELQQLHNAQLDDVLSRERKKIVKGHQVLKDNDKAWRAVLSEADESMKAGEYQGDIPGAIEAAAVSLYGEASVPEVVTNAQKEASGVTTTAGKAPSKGLSLQEIDYKVFLYSDSGEHTTEEVVNYGARLRRQNRKAS